ncbi:MAG TPA: tryptophan synthase subunit beta, partial [Dehalococcoidia bacterium]|nr:tryptophan synthase subunit beta [Dehalococcoidia bacterium]
MNLPDKDGHFGPYGGKFVPETLMPALSDLETAYAQACADPAFWNQFHSLCRNYA